jgi:acyl carrier protein
MDPAVRDPSTATDEAAVISVVRELLAQLQPGRSAKVRGDSALDRDLGLDSLGRVELLLRLQKRFGVTLPERSAFAAETIHDLTTAIAEAGPAAVGAARPFAPPAPEPVDALPIEVGTLVEVLGWHARRQGTRVHLRLEQGTAAPEPLTYSELLDGASRLAAGLRSRDLGAHPMVALMLPTSREFFVAFFGVLLAGGTPVPIYPPFRLAQLEEHLRRQAGILQNAEARLLVASAESRRFGALLRARVPSMSGVSTVSELSSAPLASLPAVGADDLALVQYTSGSTGDPKGVLLTHANLLANIRAMGEQARIRSTDTVVSWLPLYHDMGLIGAWLGSLYHACPLVVMPPSAFLTRPERWLWTIHQHRGTVSAAPNFAYELVASRIDDARLAGLDLSSWRLAFNGSEPVSPSTIERFTTRFARHGFSAAAMTPVYGLAEGALGVTFPPAGRGPRAERVDRDRFARDGRAIPDPAGTLSFVSSGLPLPGHEVRIVDRTGHEAPERTEGRIQFRGPSATSGYLRNPAATRALLAGDWLETGDLGYVAAGELFVTGRAKDVIIRAGRHLFPYELEQVVAAAPGVRKGGVAAFAVSSRTLGTEALVIVAETAERTPDAQAELRSRIDAVTADLLGAKAEEVLLVPPRTVPKTSSGKLRRAACRELYERGALTRVRSVRWQFLRLAVGTALRWLRLAGRHLLETLYAGWFWAMFALFTAPAFLAAVLPRRLGARRKLVGTVIRGFFRVAGVPLEIGGLQHLPPRSHVVVANHSSYLDGLVLAALLPPRYAFVAKSELRNNAFTRLAFRRLGAELVERRDAERGAADAERLGGLLERGQSLVFFPEGTLRRAHGTFPFRMGAFLLAARADAPVVPLAIVGTRLVLRGDQWFPRRGAIEVTVLPAVTKEGDTWARAVRLRDDSRRRLALATDEPEVAEP